MQLMLCQLCKCIFMTGYYSYCEGIRRLSHIVTDPPNDNFQPYTTLCPIQLCDFEIVFASECTNGRHNLTELQYPICTK